MKYDFEAVAELSGLSFDSREKAAFENDFKEMLEFAGKLSGACDSDNPDCGSCPLREDIPHDSFLREDMLSNAPSVSDVYISVPKVL